MMKRWSGLSYLLMAVLVLQGCAGWIQEKRGDATGSAQAAPVAPRKDAPVVIVGAGLTGLTIAYELKKAGIDALLIEASPRVGGRIQTVSFADGVTAEAHMEEYFARNPAVKLLKELDLMSQPLDEVREKSAEALDNLFPGVRKHIKSAGIFVYPQAVAYWPLELGRSRFDELAKELRRPQGRLYIGGDTTVDSHSEGAVVSGLEISKHIISRRAELQ